VSEAIYEQNFWKATNKGPLPIKNGKPDMDIIHPYAHETMDQTVTSKWHKEAYNPGEVALDDFLNKGMVPTITRVEDVRDTITIKSDIWFDRAAAKTADPTTQARNMAEGMRQASKQYDDIILSRMKSYGMDPAAVPPQLQASMNIFKKVEAGEVTAKQAEAMLAAIGTSPQKAVKDMGSMFETIEKVTGKAARAETQTYVAATVKQMATNGAPNWHNAALTEINSGLKSGMLSGPDFMKMRSEVIQDVRHGRKRPRPRVSSVPKNSIF
jgi:ribosome-binding protein aMBF1 (putative translation factor)